MPASDPKIGDTRDLVVKDMGVCGQSNDFACKVPENGTPEPATRKSGVRARKG